MLDEQNQSQAVLTETNRKGSIDLFKLKEYQSLPNNSMDKSTEQYDTFNVMKSIDIEMMKSADPD